MEISNVPAGPEVRLAKLQAQEFCLIQAHKHSTPHCNSDGDGNCHGWNSPTMRLAQLSWDRRFERQSPILPHLPLRTHPSKLVHRRPCHIQSNAAKPRRLLATAPHTGSETNNYKRVTITSRDYMSTLKF